MAKANNKTKEEKALSVDDFLATLSDPEKLEDCKAILKMMGKVTGAKPAMWGSSIIGFGNTTLKYETGRVVDWFIMGLSPRKANLSIYLTSNIAAYAKTLEKLGKHKTGAGCLYISKLADVDVKVLEKLMKDCMADAVKASKVKA